MAAKKHGLGRGLDALISSDTKAAEQAQAAEKEKQEQAQKDKVQMVPVSMILADTTQPRKLFEETALQELADSIKSHGILEPLLARKEGEKYRLIAGERRLRAAKMAGLREVPVLIRENTPEETLEISLIENIQREDLNPVEEAKAYQQLMTRFHLKQDELAKRVGKSRPAVANSLRLLNLDDEVLSYVVSGELSEGHAKVLAGVSSKEKQREITKKVLQNKLSVRQTERLVSELGAPKTKKAPEADGAYLAYRKASRNLEQKLGTKVTILPGRKKGRIEIEYYSEEELERLLELLEHVKT